MPNSSKTSNSPAGDCFDIHPAWQTICFKIERMLLFSLLRNKWNRNQIYDLVLSKTALHHSDLKFKTLLFGFFVIFVQRGPKDIFWDLFWSFFKYVKIWQFQGYLSTPQKKHPLRKSKFPFWFMSGSIWDISWASLIGHVPYFREYHKPSNVKLLLTTYLWRVKGYLSCTYWINMLDFWIYPYCTLCWGVKWWYFRWKNLLDKDLRVIVIWILSHKLSKGKKRDSISFLSDQLEKAWHKNLFMNSIWNQCE